MATIQVRDLAPEVVEAYRARAKAEGTSLQQYMKDFLTAAAPSNGNRELFDQIERTLQVSRSTVSLEDIVADIRELRDAS